MNIDQDIIRTNNLGFEFPIATTSFERARKFSELRALPFGESCGLDFFLAHAVDAMRITALHNLCEQASRPLTEVNRAKMFVSFLSGFPAENCMRVFAPWLNFTQFNFLTSQKLQTAARYMSALQATVFSKS